MPDNEDKKIKELQEQRESKRSLVRITVTYAATAFLFGIGAIMITVL